MEQAKFIQENELPYSQFEQIGLSRRDVLNLGTKNIDSLLSGSRTSILNLSIPDGQEKLNFSGKLSLQRNPDDSVSLIVHPVRSEIKNDIGLNEKEIERLKAGELFNKNIAGERYLLQLDRDTNEVMRAKTKDINIPLDVKTSDRERLLDGKSITLQTETGVYNFQLDLEDKKGYKIRTQGEEEEEKLSLKNNSNNESNYKKIAIMTGLLINPLLGLYFVAKDLDLFKNNEKYNISDRDLHNLLDGKKTDVKDLSKIEENLAGKLSLQRNPDDSVSLMVHPVRSEIKNDYKLNDEEIERLKDGELLIKKINGDRCFLQLDRDTNEVMKAKVDNIIPSHVKGVEVTKEDKKQLINYGRLPVYKSGKDGESFSFSIDLSNANGLKIDDDRNKLINMAFGNSKSAIVSLYSAHPGGSDANVRDFVERNNIEAQFNVAHQSWRNVLFEPAFREDYLQRNPNASTEQVDKAFESAKIKAKEDDNALKQAALNSADAKIMAQVTTYKGLDLKSMPEKQKMTALKDILFDKLQKINFDRFNPGVADVIKTDANRSEKLDLEKGQGKGQSFGNDVAETSKSHSRKF